MSTTVTHETAHQSTATAVEPFPETPRHLAAKSLLEDARSRRWTIPANEFPGFSAAMTFHDDGRRFDGRIRVKNPGDMTIDLPDGADREWVRGVMAMNVMHRLATPVGMVGPLDKPVRLAEGEENLLGAKMYFEGDMLGSSYRIRDGIITEVIRTMHGSTFTITTLECTTCDDGRLVPKHYIVTYFDPATGNVNGVAQYTEEYEKVAGFYLPKFIRVIETRGNLTTVRGAILSDFSIGS